MESEVAFGKRAVQSLGTTMMVTWVLILGPIGAVLLGGVAYAMLARNPVQGVFCGLMLFLPLCLTITWGIGTCFQVLRQERLRTAALVLAIEPVDSATC